MASATFFSSKGRSMTSAQGRGSWQGRDKQGRAMDAQGRVWETGHTPQGCHSQHTSHPISLPTPTCTCEVMAPTLDDRICHLSRTHRPWEAGSGPGKVSKKQRLRARPRSQECWDLSPESPSSHVRLPPLSLCLSPRGSGMRLVCANRPNGCLDTAGRGDHGLQQSFP